MTDQTAPPHAAPVAAPQTDRLNMVALGLAAACALAGLGALIAKVAFPEVMGLCGVVIGGCMAIVQRPAQ